ncbi:hypothetical protein ACSNOJ_08065 [Streptomyces sp. URMC 128]
MATDGEDGHGGDGRQFGLPVVRRRGDDLADKEITDHAEVERWSATSR